MIDFHVGQQIVCINAKPLRDGDEHLLDGLEEGAVYTVRFFGLDIDANVVVRLKEIIRPIREEDEGQELGYIATRFRPLIKTDISVFMAMLAPTLGRVRTLEGACA